MKILSIFILLLSLSSNSLLAKGSSLKLRETAEKLAKVVLKSGFSLPYQMDDRGNTIDLSLI